MKTWILAALLLVEAGAFELIGVDTLEAVGDPASDKIRGWGGLCEYGGNLLVVGTPFNVNQPAYREAFVEIKPSDSGFVMSSLPRRRLPIRSTTALKPWTRGYSTVAHNLRRLDSGQVGDSGIFLVDMANLDDMKPIRKIDAPWQQFGHRWMDTSLLQVNRSDSGRYLFREFNRSGEVMWTAEHRFQKLVHTSDTGGRIESFNFMESKKHPDGGLILVGYFGEYRTSGLIKLKPNGELGFIRYFDWSPIKSYQYLRDAYTSVQVTRRNHILCIGFNGGALVMHLYAANGDSLHATAMGLENPLSVSSFVYDSRYYVSVKSSWHQYESFIMDDDLRILHRDTLDVTRYDQADIGGMSQVLIGKTLFRLVVSGYTDTNKFSLWRKRLPDLAPVGLPSVRKPRAQRRRPVAHNVLGRILSPPREPAD